MSKDQRTTDLQVSEIGPGVTLKSEILTRKDKQLYLFTLNNNSFKTVSVSIDFDGSQNIEVVGTSGLIVERTLQSFSEEVVCQLLLLKGYKVKTTVKCKRDLPSLEDQKNALQPAFAKIDRLLAEFKEKMGIVSIDTHEFELERRLQKYKLRFIDSEFPPKQESIVSPFSDEEFEIGFQVHWRRNPFATVRSLADFGKEEQGLPVIFKEEIAPFSVKIGQLNNNAFFAVLSLLSIRPKLLKRLFVSTSHELSGYVFLKVLEMGRWQKVLLDTYLPCLPGGGPAFLRCAADETWACLLEKALAKSKRSYVNLVRSKFAHLISDLTGCPVSTVPVVKNEGSVSEENKAKVWKKLSKWISKGYLLAVDLEFTDEPDGLIAIPTTHRLTFPILQTAEVDARTIGLAGGESAKVVILASIWGEPILKQRLHFDYAKMSSEFKQKQLKISKTSEASTIAFLLSDLLKLARNIHVCRVKNWYETRLFGRFTRRTLPGQTDHPHFGSQWFYQFEIMQDSEVIFGVHQQDAITSIEKQIRPVLDIGILVFKVTNGQKLDLIRYLPEQFCCQFYLKQKLAPGTYVALPISSGLVLLEPTQSKSDPFEVSLLKSKLVIDEIFANRDTTLKNELGQRQLAKVSEIFGEPLGESEFTKTVAQFKIDPEEEKNGLLKLEFRKWFSDKLRSKPDQQKLEIMKKFGYEKNYFSFNSRPITVTVHSSQSIKLVASDAFEFGFNLHALDLLLTKYGEQTFGAKDNPKSPDVRLISVFNP